MNQAQIRAFHAVATEGGFSAAARHLGLTQPAVTLQVKALEARHGVSLFHRRGRKVGLTDAGRQLFGLTRRLLALEGEAEELLSAIGQLRRGRLKVAADGPYHVIEILAAYHEQLPGVHVTVDIANSDALRRSLLAYECDVAVLAGASDDAAFHELPFRRHPLVLFVARDHPWGRRRRVRLAELQAAPMVLREEGSATRRIFEAALAAAGVTADAVLEIGSREAVHEAVAAGLGIGVVAAPELGRDERLHSIEIADRKIESWEYVAALSERHGSPFIATFLDVAADLART
ncbi:MAG: LysR substrate-binding domain-containing protein [Alphaproteobacteria bacterium]|jgi:aminoethylphosphonate catabolism LysR family transcriptional regulator|nr:LysR substrate-binding domain-containing protein [Alphaproteobacteria bacterium]